ncbi:MAG: type II toxin-antitoxin system VapC family toxin [Acidobacteria bacterium]|nr:type II toxin-antitoxin system VapC family toxin [Acidobacteriota bacterium]
MSDLNVFDSWAVIAWLLKEPAGPSVAATLRRAATSEDCQIFMSWVNVGEVYYMVSRKRNRRAAEKSLDYLLNSPIQIVQPGPQDFIDAARLKATRRVSYADAFAAVLAQDRGATVVTGDPEFRALTDIISVEWIGPPVH